MDGPCCQRARLAVDHAEVANAKISARNAAYPSGRNSRPMKKMTTAVRATKKEAQITSTRVRLARKSPFTKALRTGVSAGFANFVSRGEKIPTAFLNPYTTGAARTGTATGYQL